MLTQNKAGINHKELIKNVVDLIEKGNAHPSPTMFWNFHEMQNMYHPNGLMDIGQ